MTVQSPIGLNVELPELLLASGRLDVAAVDRARRAAAATGDRFDQVLLTLGLLSESDLASSFSQLLRWPLLSTPHLPARPILTDRLPASFVRSNRVLPVRVEANVLTLAVVDPLDRVPIDAVALAVDHQVACCIIAPADFSRAVEILYGEDRPNGAAIPAAGASEHDLERLRDSASEAPVIRLVNQLIGDGVDMRASDIYIEPSLEGLVVRFRVDGMLRKAAEIQRHLAGAVVSRIKIMARLDIAERRLPQDGRIKLAIRGHDIDFRVASAPTIDGETLTLRVLDKSKVKLDFPALGFEPGQIDALHGLMEQPNGIVLVTGPTGSGKTTTLYTMLKRLNDPSVKIFTVEDPVEYQIPGISQVQVMPSIDLDFPAVLRAILRHHPNMIMVGEIRDAETARIAIQAALTGHLVFSTLHTNSAAESVTRLLDIGIEHFMLGSTLRGVMAQRLVRRLCRHCARAHEAAPRLSAYLLDRVPDLNRRGAPNLLQPVGCDACAGSGYAGQMSIAEIITLDSELRQCILDRLPAARIAERAHAKGMPSIYDDGIGKAWSGLTSVEEVLRVTTDSGS
jgi:general secretion pathway protein E